MWEERGQGGGGRRSTGCCTAKSDRQAYANCSPSVLCPSASTIITPPRLCLRRLFTSPSLSLAFILFAAPLPPHPPRMDDRAARGRGIDPSTRASLAHLTAFSVCVRPPAFLFRPSAIRRAHVGRVFAFAWRVLGRDGGCMCERQRRPRTTTLKGCFRCCEHQPCHPHP